MSVIETKGSKPGATAVVHARDGRCTRGGDRLSVNVIIDEAIADIEAGVEFWKTIVTSGRSKRGHSSEFLNRGG